MCFKGTHLGEDARLETRLLHPMIGKRRASWDRALALVARRFAETIAEHGPDSVAFYVSGQLLTEDYYVANKLMKGFIGSGNIDTNSRLCMSSAVTGHFRSFGEDVVRSAMTIRRGRLIGCRLQYRLGHPIIWHDRAAAPRAIELW